MCGIAGFYHLNSPQAPRPDLLKRMIDSLAHRGPDGEGMYFNDRIALGHRRLAIIDLTSGQQPMYRQHDKLVLVFNGEIYNYIELREELEKLGHAFISKSDSEVILAAYQQWGTACVTRFNGMWAFALWDDSNRRLFCSRDRAGEKPLFYANIAGTFIFGSEPKAIFAYGVPREIDIQHLDAYLCFGYVPAPDSFFSKVNKLPAGHNLIIENSRLTIQQYWDIDFTPDPSLQGKSREVRDQFAELFTDAVRLRMRSDVPFGAFLSGGLDSSSVVSVMPQFSDKPVSTFTIGFGELAFDERGLARLVAEKFGTQHTESVVNLRTGLTAIDSLSGYFDEPFGDSSALPTYAVSNEARKYVSMVLTGDGGDEVLSGYPVHQSEKIAGWLNVLPQSLRKMLIAFPLELFSKVDHGRGGRLLQLYRLTQMPLANRILHKQNCVAKKTREEILDNSNKAINPAIDYVHRVINKKSQYSDWNQLNYWLFKVSLADDMLAKVDRTSMANSLETRVPFLDHRIIEFLAKVPASMKMPLLNRKDILRKSIATALPKELLTAPKRGFTAPESALNLLADRVGVVSERLRSLSSVLPMKRRALDSLLVHSGNISTNAWWTLLMLTSVLREEELES